MLLQLPCSVLCEESKTKKIQFEINLHKLYCSDASFVLVLQNFSMCLATKVLQGIGRGEIN